MCYGLCGMNCVLLVLCYECVLWVMCYANISKYAGLSNLTGKNQAGPSMFSAYQSESLVKICYLLRSGNNFLFVGLSNSVFKSRSFLQ